ncbi:cytochrome D1 domain-containing protein [Zestomonas carbonaria]|uniref:cytochrome D1 domain-containing protein n=1 Tax=Zestomonas carbonaria TaxID=2762745 RepID=UPI0016572CFC|nr:cytochrome D1 domain-containing protein [Pseudomonas carbonaria]
MQKTIGVALSGCVAIAGVVAWQLFGTQAGNPPADAAASAGSDPNRLVRDGVVIEFEALPVGGGPLTEGLFADVRFRLTDAATGQPLSGLAPGAWLDQGLAESDDRAMQCKSRTSLYLKGGLNAKPLLDLNSYYLLVMNKDASLTVIDPTTSVGGITSTLMRIALKRPPMDWVASADDRLLYVSMPDAGEVALVDTEKFQVLASLPAGRDPLRVALQPDGRYLWVGNNARDEADSGVTVIDTQTREIVLQEATGKGHHEIAFSDDSRHAFVSNRDAGTVSVFDIAGLKRLDDIPTGSNPLSLAFSSLSQAVYVVDGREGRVTVLDARSLAVRKVIPLQQGVGPMGFSPDGRFGLVLNTLENQVAVIDAASDTLLHRLEVAAEPYQLVFTRAYAYVRGLASPRVGMINLGSLGEGRQPIVQTFEAGPAAPKLAGDLPLAASLSPARDEAAVFVVNPVDNTTYFYMEGMNAPMSGYLNRGHTARAVRVVDRSLREVEPGVFGSRIKLPVAGPLDVAFMLNQPQLIHCFGTVVQGNPALEKQVSTPRVEFLLDSAPVTVGSPARARFRILQGRDSQPRAGIEDLQVRYFLAPASRPRQAAAREVEEGVYEALVEVNQAGAYYLHVGSASLGLAFGDQPYASLRALPGQPASTAQTP